MLIGYARVSTTHQDLTAQHDGPHKLGVDDMNIYVDHGLTGRDRERPGLKESSRRSARGRPAGGHEARPPCPLHPGLACHRR